MVHIRTSPQAARRGPITGQQTSTGSPAQLASNACREVVVKADLENTGTILVGGATPLFKLYPGDWVKYAAENTNWVYISGTGSVSWTAEE